MQQRGVITFAIIAALILAGYMWYVLSQRTETLSTRSTPTPTVSLPTAQDGAPLETAPLSAEVAAPTPAPTLVGPAVQGGQDVTATAGSGTRENVIVALIGITLLSGGYLYRQWRQSASSR